MNKILTAILIFFSLSLSSQVESDARLWSGITVKKEIEDFEFSLSQEMRLDENISHIDKVFTEIGVEYKITKGFFASFNYRFDRDNDYETRNYDLNQRIDFGIAYKHKFDDFRLGYRIKYQTKTAHPEENNPTFLRNKVNLQYKKDDFTPFIAYEFFYMFSNENVINRTRISLGTKYSINKKNSLKAFYTFENRFNVRRLKQNHIWGISYAIEI